MADITIVQLATPNIDQYAKFSIASARNYAQRHGYQLMVQRSKTIEDLHINWTKIDLMNRVLDERPPGDDSFVVLLDADTVIMRPEMSIEHFIEHFGSREKAIFMAADTPFSFRVQKKPNAGFVIVRNNAVGKQIIEKWIHSAYNDCRHLNDTHPRNQLVYWNCVEPKYRKHQVVLPKSFFHKPLWWVPKPMSSRQFLFHVTSTDVAKRALTLKHYYEKSRGSQKNLEETEVLLNTSGTGLVKLS